MGKPFKPVNFGRYLLTERIAIGGMAEIFSAKIFGAMGFEKSMVIKRILPQFAADAEFLRMFITEAKLVCHLEHPNIVQVHELGEIDGQYYISMEFVNGIDGRQLWRTLAKRKQRLPGVLALFVVGEFLKGLDYAHRAVGPEGRLLGVVHRDVSPSNILISFRGDVKIGDFGIALVQQESKTQAGVLKGKYGYMSPEQVAGLNVDHRSDIFAAGIVLAELLLGRRLFLGRSDFETLDKVMNVRLDVLEQHEEALPPEVVRIVRLALQREPADRYQSAREFHDDILEFLFQRGERVSNETLAAFIAQHVAPYLAHKGDTSTSTGAAAGSNSAPAPGAQSPILPSGIVPRDVRTNSPSSVEVDGVIAQQAPSQQRGVSQEPTDEVDLRASAGMAAGGGYDDAGIEFEIEMDAAAAGNQPSAPAVSIAPPGQHGAPATNTSGFDVSDVNRGMPGPFGGLDAAPTAQSSGYQAEGLEADDLFGPADPANASAQSFGADPGGFSDPSYSSSPAQPAAQPQQASQSSDGALQPLWENVIDADYQFGAIPQLDLDDGESHTGELDLDGFNAEEHRALANRPAGFIEAPGTEFELDSGLEENVAYLIPGVVKQQYQQYQDHEPQVMTSQQLASAHQASEDKKRPDFAGKLGTRTVAKVLFRFGLVEESGLLALTGPERGGIHAENRLWLHELVADAAKRAPTELPTRRSCEIRLEEGQPRLISADRSEESLVSHLITTGELEREAVKVAVLANPHRSLVAALLSAGRLGPLQISRFVTSYVLDTVLDTFAWQDGEFGFFRGREVDHEAFPTGMDLLELISKGVSTIDEPTLDTYFEQFRGNRVLPSQTPPTHVDAFEPDDVMVYVYRSLGRGYAVHDAIADCASSGPSVKVKQALYTLIECELAELA